jgi:hypothetical protein
LGWDERPAGREGSVTEREWLASQNAGVLLRHLKRSPRKVRLALCGCLRAPKVWSLLPSLASRQAVVVSESFADGAVDAKELGQARKRANAASGRAWRKRQSCEATARLANLACLQDSHLLGYGFNLVEIELSRIQSLLPPELPLDLLGDPFRTPHVQSTWRTPTVISVLRAAYDNRTSPSGLLDPVRLTILADALEEAGCADEAILGHLRSPGLHVRGCWVLDLLLNRE